MCNDFCEDLTLFKSLYLVVATMNQLNFSARAYDRILKLKDPLLFSPAPTSH
jgi:hypothetical protein